MDMPVDYSQFSELTAEKIEDGIVITCTGITDIGKKVLNDQIAESLEAMEGSAEINDFTYSITLKDGKYESMSLSCDYVVSVEDSRFLLKLNIGASFDYENVADILPPEDMESYTSVTYGDIIGGL